MKKIKEFFIRFFHRKRLIRWGIYVLLLVLLFLFRAPILRGVGNWLINEDDLEKADAIVMLGGNSYERSFLTHSLYQKKYANVVVTTGSNCSVDLQSYGITITEAEQSKYRLVKMGIDSNNVIALNKGTSTLEEAQAIKQLAQSKKWKKIILVSTKFHTARVNKYFNRILADSGIKLIVRGCDPLKYQINEWWKKEEGLIMVNNEYVKSFYYWWNY